MGRLRRFVRFGRFSRRQIASMAALAMLFTGGACLPGDGAADQRFSEIGPEPGTMGRPLRRRRGGTLLLPAADDEGGSNDRDARTEYASVASFGEVALRLIAVGAPPDLVAACHRAALDEIRHASLTDELTGHERRAFGAVPGLLGRRIGGRRCSRRRQLARIAVESYLDGWIGESAGATELRRRAEQATSPRNRANLIAMADDEQRHADLARAIVTWCFREHPAHVGRALGAVAKIPLAG